MTITKQLVYHVQEYGTVTFSPADAGGFPCGLDSRKRKTWKVFVKFSHPLREKLIVKAQWFPHPKLPTVKEVAFYMRVACGMADQLSNPHHYADRQVDPPLKTEELTLRPA